MGVLGAGFGDGGGRGGRYRRFYGPHSLDLMVIVRAGACVIASSIIAGVIFSVLVRTGILREYVGVALFLPLAALVISTVVTLVVCGIMLRRMLKPVTRIAEALDQVAGGDYSVRLDDDGARNVVGHIMRSFNTMAAELESTELLRDDFVSNFSHEFKTPMVSVRGFARQIMRDPTASDQVREYASIIDAEAGRLVGMSKNALVLSRVESQAQTASPRAYALDEQLRRCILLFQDSWEARGIEFDAEGLEPVEVRADEELLEQVWLNVLDNAIKFSPDGSTVHVSCAYGAVQAAAALGASGVSGSGYTDYAGFPGYAGQTVRVTVRDEGPGMDEATLARAFDKFYRGSRTADAVPGNGLGLAIVRRVVELVHGSITVRSEVGHGTEFVVTLPRDGLRAGAA